MGKSEVKTAAVKRPLKKAESVSPKEHETADRILAGLKRVHRRGIYT
ncbi:MAG: hypothetical protein AB1641_27855 [Thermodesulfobacteriota bacterium]